MLTNGFHFALWQTFPDPTISCSAEKKSSASAGGTGPYSSPGFYDAPPVLSDCHIFLQSHQEADCKVLVDLLKGEHEDRRMETARREKVVADAGWMKQVIEEQLQLEREREAEFDDVHR